jgi:hypothetical protein
LPARRRRGEAASDRGEAETHERKSLKHKETRTGGMKKKAGAGSPNPHCNSGRTGVPPRFERCAPFRGLSGPA